MDKYLIIVSVCMLCHVLVVNGNRNKRSVFGVSKYSTPLSQSEVQFYLKELSELQDKLSGGKGKAKHDKKGKKTSSSGLGGKKSKNSKEEEAPWRAGMHWWDTRHGKKDTSSSWSSSSPYQCDQPLEYGNTECTDHTVRYYYEKESKMCRKFHYTGCGGNKNNFHSKHDCQRKCNG